jgi:formylmethanofuran dehydrogenase subunit D
MEKLFTLISGRTKAQAHGLHKGPDSPDYINATSFVEIGQEDMTLLGIKEDELVLIRSDSGEVQARVHPASLPSGLIFIPMGPTANKLVGTQTFGTGMPAFKGQSVEVKKI